MPARTVKGAEFTIVVGDQRIIVKHVQSKGKRCRVIAPSGVRIECERNPDRAGASDQVVPDIQTTDDLLTDRRLGRPTKLQTRNTVRRANSE